MLARSILLLVAAVLAPAASAQTLYVDVQGVPPGSGTQGDPFTAIQPAIDAAGAGWTIEVAPGTYVGDLLVTEAVLILGTGGPMETTVVSDGSGDHVVEFLAAGELEGLRVTGMLDPSRSAVELGVSGVRLTRTIVSENAGDGVTASGFKSGVISRCTVAHNGGRGLVLPCSPGIDVDNSIVRQNEKMSGWCCVCNTFDHCLMQGEETIGGHFTAEFTNCFSANARLWDRGDYYLQPGSPAIDAGDPALLDPDGSRLDIGAVPFDPAHAPVKPRTYCTSQVNSQGCAPVVDTQGTPSLSGGSFTIDCSKVLNNKTGLFFYGFQGKATPYQGGYLCVLAPVRRTPIQSSGGNPPPDDCSGVFGFDFATLMASGKDPLLLAGQGVFGQFWYRDPQQAGSSTSSRSEGIAFQIAP